MRSRSLSSGRTPATSYAGDHSNSGGSDTEESDTRASYEEHQL